MSIQILSDKVPLRNTSVWEGFSTVETLPIGYGTVTVNPIKFTSNGLKWLILDHPIQSIISVRRSGVAETAFKLKQEVDNTGKAVAFLILETSAAVGSIEVTCNGKLHPRTGVLMTNPADIIWDILQLSRTGVLEAELDVFRRECQEFGLTVSGVLRDRRVTTRTVLDEITNSIGAVWSGGMPSIARIFPRDFPVNEPLFDSFDEKVIKNLEGRAKAKDLFTKLRLLYDFNHATDEARKVIEIEAIEVRKDQGDLPDELELKWTSNNRQALNIGTRYLQWLARKRWQYNFDCRKGVPSGGYLTFSHPSAFVGGNSMVQDTTANEMKATSKYQIEIPVGPAPTITKTLESAVF